MALAFAILHGHAALSADRDPGESCSSGKALPHGCEYSFTLTPDGYAAVFPRNDGGTIKYQLPRLRLFDSSGRLLLDSTGYSNRLAQDLERLEAAAQPEEGAATLTEEVKRLRTTEGKTPDVADLGVAEYSFIAYAADWCVPCKEELKTIRKFAASSRKSRVNILRVDADVQKLDAETQRRLLGVPVPGAGKAEEKH